MCKGGFIGQKFEKVEEPKKTMANKFMIFIIETKQMGRVSLYLSNKM